MKVLILGGTGVISRYLVKKYNNENHDVTVLNRGNRKDLSCNNGIDKILNVNNEEQLFQAVKGDFYDLVIDFTTFESEIMKMKLHILQSRCTHYVFISSVAAYARDPLCKFYTEDMPIGNHEWSYGKKKAACENTIHEMFEGIENCSYTIIRPCVTYSEMFVPYSPIDSYNMPGYLIHCIISGEEIVGVNDGEDQMQVLHAEDFSNILYTLLNKKESFNNIFNITGDEYVSSKQILVKLTDILGAYAKVCCLPQQYFEKQEGIEPLLEGGWHSTYSNKKVKSVIGSYHLKRNILDCLQEAVDYFVEHQPYIGWSVAVEKQIKKILDRAKRDGNVKESIISAKIITKERWKLLYNTMSEKSKTIKCEAEKHRINERCLEKWMALSIRGVQISSYFIQKNILNICLYGYGMFGKFLVQLLENTVINIQCVIDKNQNLQLEDMQCCVSAAGLENEYIIVSVMSDYENIVKELESMGCKHIILLETILDQLLNDLSPKGR
ncbi:MAG: NAD-dependent epimerase/dehydratase family protein [Lachnospiraceae bacterium]|nr:NAD-dependent epimerase/dehydratase family protein [Lachnospiraceae bacterium]